MWKHVGKTATVNLTGGEALQGHLCWSWTWGYVALRNVKLLEGDETVLLAGKVLIPKHAVKAVQLSVGGVL